ncbi:hypothetical protein Nepgr_017622 [Nepenthes gracilis]|uniref:FAD dependent oxidoreductase domain-containing protein n=1 Tax=Nepenthes gracilis TaxID=150966 RepID=A0AAD3XTJ0_NEPGR|nr:hypothetical protein Nepgr_017622 [Nepenthes gracilis]
MLLLVFNFQILVLAGREDLQFRKKTEGEARVTAEQACFLSCTDDGIPIIGEILGVKGCFAGTGHSCWGILNGPTTGAALSKLILDGRLVN